MTILSLTDQGLTIKTIAEALNKQDFLSCSGKSLYPELVGALISEYRKKAKSRYVHKSIIMKNEEGGAA